MGFGIIQLNSFALFQVPVSFLTSTRTSSGAKTSCTTKSGLLNSLTTGWSHGRSVVSTPEALLSTISYCT